MGRERGLKGYRLKEQFEQRPWGGSFDCSETEKRSGRGEGLFGATERVVAFTLRMVVSRKVTQLILYFGCYLGDI